MLASFISFPSLEINLFPPINNQSFLPDTSSKEDIIYNSSDEITGELVISPVNSTTTSYNKIEVSLIGTIHSKNNEYTSEFIHLNKELASEGEIEKQVRILFSFANGNVYESYSGKNLFIEYKIQANFTSKYLKTNLSSEKKINIHVPLLKAPGLLPSICHNIGINTRNNHLEVIFKLDRTKYELDDCVLGEVMIKKSDVIIESIDLLLIKGEKINGKSDSYIIGEYELCDGNLREEQVIPIRMYLSQFKITPTMKNINGVSTSVKYYLKLDIILDNDDDKIHLYKTQEIILWRCSEINMKNKTN